MEERKVIQISIGPSVDTGGYPSLYALCNDGTMWRKALNATDDFEWIQIENIP